MKSRRLVFLFAAALAMAFNYATPAQAGGKAVWENPENPCNKLILKGDMRYRMETNESTDQSGASDVKTKDTRRRIRLRFGGVYNTGMGVSAGFRLATNGGNLSSQHQTLGLGGNAGSNTAWGTDRAYLQYAHGSGLLVIAGKAGIPILQLSDAWWDTDLSPEGYVIAYTGVENLTIGVTRYVITERKDVQSSATDGDEDDLVTAITVAYGMEAGPVNLKLGATSATWANGQGTNKPAGTKDVTYNLIVVGAKMDQLSGGIEYFTSNAGTTSSDLNQSLTWSGSHTGFESADKTGMVIHVRYKINDMLGIRAYYYDMGALSAPIPQDDFQMMDNFTGTRLQLDIAFAGMKIDLRAYNQSSKNNDIDGTDASKWKASRLQANFNVGF